MSYTQKANERRISAQSRRVLVVDDDEINLEILMECLSRCGDEVKAVESGMEAIEVLQTNPDGFDIILLDRMMPQMSGIEVFSYIQNHPRLQQIPVVMQTAAATRGDIESGLAAGILYYLSKPYNREGLFAIMSTAISDAQQHQELVTLVANAGVDGEGSYRFQTLEQAKTLALRLANSSDAPEKTVIGLYELMCNAIEHGNLGISYEEKTQLLVNQQWQDEIQFRSRQLGDSKTARVKVSKQPNCTRYTIQDEGPGFEFEQYLAIKPDRATDNHGRGIAIAKQRCFDAMRYEGNGNTVIAEVSKS